jgi:hypothetical protein
MLRFILAVVLIAVILKATQDNPYIGFGLYLFLIVAFMIHTINTVNIIECDDTEFERKMLRTPESRKQYYYMLNSK